MIALDDANVRATMAALSGLGYQPRPPVALDDFADPATRATWIEEKGRIAFSLSSPAPPATEVDLFAAEPLPFDEAYDRAVEVDLDSTRAKVAAIEDLIALKQASGRPLDLADIEALEELRDHA